jgi:transposase InsO family protein
MLRDGGEPSGINHIYRLYRKEGLLCANVEVAARRPGPALPCCSKSSPNARWSLDFVHDQFACGRRFRVLNIVDDLTRECLAAVQDTSNSGKRVPRELTTLIEKRGKPQMIVSDNVLRKRSCSARVF